MSVNTLNILKIGKVYEVESGIRAGGAAEVQLISITGSGEGERNASSPDDAVIRGYWRAQFANSNFRYVHIDRTAVEMRP